VLAGTQITVSQLRRKLQAKEFEPDVIEYGIERCTAAGLLDDERYAREFVASRVRRGHGAQRIRQDLAQRGVDRQLVDSLLAVHQDDGEIDAAAIDAARKKFARVDLEDAQVRAKALRWLQSRGYGYGQADTAVRTVRQEQADAAS
jgi:regulatory protein